MLAVSFSFRLPLPASLSPSFPHFILAHPLLSTIHSICHFPIFLLLVVAQFVDEGKEAAPIAPPRRRKRDKMMKRISAEAVRGIQHVG